MGSAADRIEKIREERIPDNPDILDDHFHVGTADTYAPYTRDDAEDRVNDIISVLEEAGFEAEQATIN